MGVRSTTVTASLALLLCAPLTSCTADEAPEQSPDAALLELERAADALSVSVLRPGAERAFARKGHPVAAPLDCTAVPEGGPSAEPSEDLAEDAVTAGGAEEPSASPGAEGAPGQRARGGRLEVRCTGQSRDGEQIRFQGRLLIEALAEREAGDDSLHGAFTGLVGEEEVFTMDCFQCSPANAQPPEKDAAASGPPEGAEPPADEE
ncbi:hypothetical protein [Nocardiopsis sp. L17-MgMaSL7]|uniref:hypothetical protein n=1 Tax=Nocardiopsis sp. L17-MgMaSL7 TaxID=1938893 RepID=UPI000D716A27|nr:hypothetical protein [Nocardiopsis sp. L17-MgMaSL7]PWV55182.1 hypothetical protein BDW27_103186 [Nocardiopsis sp. L17-MgMaSL7]